MVKPVRRTINYKDLCVMKGGERLLRGEVFSAFINDP